MSIALPKLIPVRMETKNKSLLSSLYQWVGVGRKWELADNWRYELDDETTLFIRKGFIFDGASIPRVFRPLLSPTGILLVPSLVHDFAYQNNYLIRLKGTKREYYADKKGKIYWDKLFYKMSRDVNGLKFVSFLAFAALFIGGWFSWFSYNGSGVVRYLAQKWIKYTNIFHIIVFLILIARYII
jgi:hypothetical protein